MTRGARKRQADAQAGATAPAATTAASTGSGQTPPTAPAAPKAKKQKKDVSAQPSGGKKAAAKTQKKDLSSQSSVAKKAKDKSNKAAGPVVAKWRARCYQGEEDMSPIEEQLAEAVADLSEGDANAFRAKLLQLHRHPVVARLQLKNDKIDVKGIWCFKVLDEVEVDLERYDPDDDDIKTASTGLQEDIKTEVERWKHVLKAQEIVPKECVESGDFTTLLEAWSLCYLRKAAEMRKSKNDTDNKTVRYIEYGKALERSNVEREEILQRMENSLPPELADYIYQSLVRAYLPHAAELPERCPSKVGRRDKSIILPEYFPRTTSIDTIVELMLQGFGEVELVAPDVLLEFLAAGYYDQYHGYVKRKYPYKCARHPGFQVDTTAAHVSVGGKSTRAERLREAIGEAVTIINPASFGARDAPTLPIPASLRPHRKHIKKLCLHIVFPFTEKNVYPGSIYRAIAEIPTLKQHLTSLQSLRINVVEPGHSNPRQALVRGGYYRGYNQSIVTWEQNFAALVDSLRRSDIDRCTIYYRNEDGRDEKDFMKVEQAADIVPTVDVRDEENAGVIARRILVEQEQEFVVVQKPVQKRG